MTRHLHVLMGYGASPTSRRPVPHEVLYTRPNRDGTRKKCANCVQYDSPNRLCRIHDTDLLLQPDSVCGYHVYGRPSDGGKDEHREYMDPVDPSYSGLERVPAGVSCNSCAYFSVSSSSSGLCTLVSDPNEPEANFSVEALGCCSAWTRKG
jgi:hypothetical protein